MSAFVRLTFGILVLLPFHFMRISKCVAQEEAAEGATSLRWKLSEGERLKITFTQSTRTITTVNKNALQMRVELGAELQWMVQRVDDADNMQIEQTISRLTMKLAKSDGSEAVEYDSAASQRPRGGARDVAAAAGPLIGLKVLLTLSPRGEIVAVELPMETRAAVEKIQDRSRVSSLLSPEGISEILKQAMPLLPETAASVGDSWNVQTEKELSAGKLNQTTTLTYEGPDAAMEGLLKIGVAGEVQLAAAPDAATKLTLKQQQLTGNLWYSETGHRIERGTIQQEMVTESPYRDERISTQLSTQLDFRLEEAIE